MATATFISKLSLATVGAALVALGTGKAVQAAVVSFDDITTSDLTQPIDTYGGLAWDNFFVQNSQAPGYLDTGYANGTISGDYVALNGAGFSATVGGSDTVPAFKFQGVYLTAALANELFVTVEGFKSGVQQYTQTVSLSTTNPTWLTTESNAFVDQLSFSTSGALVNESGQFAADNFTYEAVPEPSTELGSLLVLSTFGLGWLWKRQKQQKVHR